MRGTAVKGSRRMFNCRPAAASAKSTKNSRCFYNFPFWHCSSCSDKQQPWTIATEGHINCFENGNKNVSNTNSALVETNKTYHWGRQLEMLWKSTGCTHTGLNLVRNSYIIYALKSESLKLSCLGFGAAVCTSTSNCKAHYKGAVQKPCVTLSMQLDYYSSVQALWTASTRTSGAE